MNQAGNKETWAERQTLVAACESLAKEMLSSIAGDRFRALFMNPNANGQGGCRYHPVAVIASPLILTLLFGIRYTTFWLNSNERKLRVSVGI